MNFLAFNCFFLQGHHIDIPFLIDENKKLLSLTKVYELDCLLLFLFVMKMVLTFFYIESAVVKSEYENLAVARFCFIV